MPESFSSSGNQRWNEEKVCIFSIFAFLAFSA
jgi:hypothetical protein